MVNTRSTYRRENKRKEDEESQQKSQLAPPQPTDGNKPQNVEKPSNVPKLVLSGSNVKSESCAPTSKKGSKSGKSTSSSLQARRKQLELQAAEEKARIQLNLIDKKLEADLAELEDDKYSSHIEESTNVAKIEEWLQHSQPELQPARPTHDDGITKGELCPPAEQPGTSDGIVHLLASALKDLTAKNRPDATMLSRICTPKDLPVFTGDPMEWLQFKQAYEESTEVCSFTPKENLWRLRKCLRGPAKEAVTALLISASSPEKIISTLELRFGNPDIIISKIVQDIKKLQSMSSDYHKDIVPFSVKVQNYVTAVRAVGREEYLKGTELTSILLSKLPAVLISKWSDYSYMLIKEGNTSRLDILSEFLNEEAIKISTTANIILPDARINYNKYKQPENSYNRAQTVLMQAEPSDKCLFCRGAQHKLTECKQFKKALRKDRWRHVKRYGICYKCLCSRHDRETCPAAVCDKDNCGGAHHRLLHYATNYREHQTAGAAAADVQETSQPTPTETVTHINENKCKVILKTIPVRVYGPNGVIHTRALLDDGSTVSLMSAALAERAGLRGRRESMRVRGAWNEHELVCDTTVVTFNISGVHNKLHNIKVRSINQLNLPVQNLSDLDCNNYSHLLKIKDDLRSDTPLKPELLIGQDNYHLLLPLEICLGKPNEPSATRTPLGWCVHGSVGPPRRTQSLHTTLAISDDEDAAQGETERLLRELHEEVRRSFTIESMGVSGKSRQNINDVRAQEKLEQTATLVNGRWRVGLPWIDEHRKMPDSYPNALLRLKGVEKKMAANKSYADRYEDRVNHLFENDYAQELTDAKLTSNTWYLPHFGVDNPNKKKLRLVFDAAAKTKGLSLNDYLLTGPDLLASLFGIMVRFRENRVAVTGDIKDMFLRIKIRPEDQNALRFLWRKSQSEPLKTYVMTSLIFGANCSPFIAQFIKNKNAIRFESTMPDAVAAICTQHYMDDYIDSLPDEATAIDMVRNISSIHKAGGFEIRNWTSNSTAVLDSVPEDTLGTVAVRFKTDQQYEGERTLGLIWYPREDEWGFDVSFKRIPENIIHGKHRPTKRIMLKIVMSIFDVFGFLSPFTIQGKIMLQDAWQLKIGWDTTIPNNLYDRWCEWIDLLKGINLIRLPRYYQSASGSEMETKPTSETVTIDATYSRALPTPGALRPCVAESTCATTAATCATNTTGSATECLGYNNLELHTFCDASTKAMCAVAYWRWNSNGHIHVAFIASKCRVAPVKQTTVPRLELQAALLASRLADTITKEHKLTATRRYFWCDSTTVLHWINNNTRSYKVFVANRLGEIDELTRADEWRYIPTKLNVADIATRDSYDEAVFKNEWFKGPSFLYNHAASWPASKLPEREVKDADLECVNMVQNTPGTPVPDPQRFSSWLRLVRATAAVLKFINRCKKRDATEWEMIEQAKRLLLRHAQAESFGQEIAAIKNKGCVQESSKLLTLCPVLDEHGILRVDGRIDAAAGVSSETKRPIILDGRHQVAKLIVNDYHIKAAHGHQEAVVNHLKQKYWIIRLRPTVKHVVARCMLCRLRKTKPEIPMMGDLPEARLAHNQRPFSHCGIDLFGPMEVTIGRRREKRYGVLFTCLTVRAIHLEIVSSLSTDALIMALRRMASRRGWPCHLYSDNGTNLRGADNELKRSILELDNETLKSEASNNGVQWTFIPPASPHWGGAWERLVRTVKTALRVVLKERAPREEVLSTLMAEVENIVNSRPLTHVSVEPDSAESLTPNHFLLGSSSNLPVQGKFDDSDMYLRKQWRKAQLLTDMFWKRWVKEILPELLPRQKWNREQRPLRIGDVVLIVDPDAPRNVWHRALVMQVFPGKDGRIRVVQLKTKSGTLMRPAARVARIPMDVECCDSTGVGRVGDAKPKS